MNKRFFGILISVMILMAAFPLNIFAQEESPTPGCLLTVSSELNDDGSRDFLFYFWIYIPAPWEGTIESTFFNGDSVEMNHEVRGNHGVGLPFYVEDVEPGENLRVYYNIEAEIRNENQVWFGCIGFWDISNVDGETGDTSEFQIQPGGTYCVINNPNNWTQDQIETGNGTLVSVKYYNDGSSNIEIHFPNPEFQTSVTTDFMVDGQVIGHFRLAWDQNQVFGVHTNNYDQVPWVRCEELIVEGITTLGMHRTFQE